MKLFYSFLSYLILSFSLMQRFIKNNCCNHEGCLNETNLLNWNFPTCETNVFVEWGACINITFYVRNEKQTLRLVTPFVFINNSFLRTFFCAVWIYVYMRLVNTYTIMEKILPIYNNEKRVRERERNEKNEIL